MNKIIALNVIGCFFICILNAQIAQNNNATLNALNDLAFFVDVNNSKYAGAEGSRYLFDKFVPAKINEIKTSHAVRFDIVEDIVEFKDSEGQIKGLSKDSPYRISLLDGTNRVFVTNSFVNDDGVSGNSLFEEIYVSKHFGLYKKERIKFQEAKPAKSSYEPAKPAKFIKLPDAFYLFYPDKSTEALIEIPRKKKKLKNFFGEAYPPLEKFTKKNNLDFDSESDLIKILNHYIQIK